MPCVVFQLLVFEFVFPRYFSIKGGWVGNTLTTRSVWPTRPTPLRAWETIVSTRNSEVLRLPDSMEKKGSLFFPSAAAIISQLWDLSFAVVLSECAEWYLFLYIHIYIYIYNWVYIYIYMCILACALTGFSSGVYLHVLMRKMCEKVKCEEVNLSK